MIFRIVSWAMPVIGFFIGWQVGEAINGWGSLIGCIAGLFVGVYIYRQYSDDSGSLINILKYFFGIIVFGMLSFAIYLTILEFIYSENSCGRLYGMERLALCVKV